MRQELLDKKLHTPIKAALQSTIADFF